jgi:hypothetical protein
MRGQHFCGPGRGSEVWDSLKRCVRKSGQDVGEVIAHRDFEATAAFDHGDDGGHARSGRFASDVDPVASAESNSPDILPMSAMNWRFTIGGIRFTGGRFAIEIASAAAQRVLSMWTMALAW